tara:strand:+ start:14511 stop:14711 length:201 start_codon:yes stop_codon:yes gene_type:complete
MKVGDLVFEVPFGKEWFQKNPWLTSPGFGIITELISEYKVMVWWSSGEYQGRLEEYDTDYLVKVEA